MRRTRVSRGKQGGHLQSEGNMNKWGNEMVIWGDVQPCTNKYLPTASHSTYEQVATYKFYLNQQQTYYKIIS